MSSADKYTVEHVEQAFQNLSAVMQKQHKYTPEKEAFVKECLEVAAKYINQVGTNVAGYTGLRISSDLAIVMVICGGAPNNIVTTVFTLRDNTAERELAPSDIVRYIGANNFARMLCETLDNSRKIRETILSDGEHIDNYMRERLAKAKADQPSA